MTYDEAIDYIHGAHKYGWKLGLKNMTRLLDLMGNPHKNLRYVHVAGTNGKGSTVAFISSILIESGYKVGVFTSPYLERFTERIRINDREIDVNDLARITGFVKEKVHFMVARGENHPTEFEIVTAIAFQYYYEMNCDIVVLEVGLGGRFDSTNVIDTPLVSVITTISYDHMQWLGDTLPAIAFEKAGIIKNAGEVVAYPQDNDVWEVFEKVCAERGAHLNRVGFDNLKVTEFGIDGQVFNYNDYHGLRISLLGGHQAKNAAVSIKCCEILREKGFKITENTIRTGLAKAVWPGRIEVLRKDPVFIIDGAHNAEGARMLSNTLKEYFPDQKVIFILGVLKDKDYESMVKEVLPVSRMFIAVTPDSERALPADELAIFLKRYCKNILISDTIDYAVKKSMEIADTRDVICAFGSLYYIGKIRSILKSPSQICFI